MTTLRHMKFEVLPHPPYSPDLTPCDFHLFGPLKESLRGRKFTLNNDVQSAMHEWLRGQPQDFFSSGIQALISCTCKCIELQRDYVRIVSRCFLHCLSKPHCSSSFLFTVDCTLYILIDFNQKKNPS